MGSQICTPSPSPSPKPLPVTVFDVERQYFLAAVGQLLRAEMTAGAIQDEIDSTIRVVRQMATLADYTVDGR
jgi:hypothetical protein